MTIRKEKVEGFRKLLTARREALAADLRQTTSNLVNDDAVYSDAIDQASADIDKSFALSMKNRERNTLGQIDEALKRIDAGTFDTCERCEESISEARLKAFPFTTLCIDCKSELESEEHRMPGRVAG
jgi:DnaK suppressor protein